MQGLFYAKLHINDFEKLQHINFPKLQTLKIPYQCPKPEYLMKFLEINGKNLRRVYICEGICEGIFNTVFNPKGLNKNLILSIANFCPNLERLSVRINSEFISVWCGKKDMTGILFDIVATYSSKYFCELVLYNSNLYLINSKDLELFLISWKNRKPKKLLTLVIIRNTTIDEYEEYKGNIINDENNEDSHDELSNRDQNLKIIEEYKKLDIIKFRIENIKEEEESEYYFY
uniref:F-box domain-containing protein n=1 Tax=Rhizophagus irregularis (strain DAOM 181602 / DAOM 197198 / MUCL 43194) TaxID=747089 RepID=U9SP86_RHIID